MLKRTVPLKLLVAEDNELNKEVARKMLERLGHSVDVASNGHEAIARLESARYDVVFLDCQMPLLDGYDTARRIRVHADPDLRVIPIIGFTADAMKENRERCLQVGMDDFISKPVNRQSLSDALQKWTAANGIDRAAIQNLESLDSPGDSPGDSPWFPPVLEKCFELFTDHTPVSLERIRKAIINGDRKTIGREAHALKASSGTMGARMLAVQCGTMEEIAGSDSMIGAEELVAKMELEYERAREELSGVIKSRRPKD